MPTVIVGSATVDEQIGVDGVSRLQIGGVVSYAGAVFANAGLSPTVVSTLGGPWAGSARVLLARMGIKLCESQSDAMTSFRNRVLPDGEREQDVIGLAPSVDAELIARALEGVERPHVHLGPLHAEDISGPALRIIAARAATVTLDVQGLLRASTLGRVREEAARLLPDALAMSRVVKAGQEELRALLGSGIRLRSSYGGQVVLAPYALKCSGTGDLLSAALAAVAKMLSSSINPTVAPSTVTSPDRKPRPLVPSTSGTGLMLARSTETISETRSASRPTCCRPIWAMMKTCSGVASVSPWPKRQRRSTIGMNAPRRPQIPRT